MRKNIYKRGRPSVRLYTNNLLKEDIELLIKKLKKLGLRFYTSPKLSEKKGKGYILCLDPDDTFKFFKLIGLKPIERIKDCVTGIRKGKICTFGEKWPKKGDWIKILAKTEGMGEVIKKRRKELNLSQRELAEEVGVKKHQTCEIECGRRFTHLKRFEKFLEVLKLDIYDILRKLNNLNER